MGTMRTIQECVSSGQESGVVIYNDSGNAFICNWSLFTGLPFIFTCLSSPLGLSYELEVIDRKDVDSWKNAMKEHVSVLVDDPNNDWKRADDGPAEMLTINAWRTSEDDTHAVKEREPDYSITVIAPAGWN